MIDVDSYLEACYRKAVTIASEGDGLEKYFTCSPFLEAIVNQVENCNGVLTVITTSLVYKIYHPEQDVRNHQVGIKGGYSGRVFDTQHITPFFQSKGWPAMLAWVCASDLLVKITHVSLSGRFARWAWNFGFKPLGC